MSAFNAFLLSNNERRQEKPIIIANKRKSLTNVEPARKQPDSNRYNDELSMPVLRPSSVVANTVLPIQSEQTVKCRTIETSAGPIQIVVRKHPEPEPQITTIRETDNVSILPSFVITPNNVLNIQHQPPEQLLQPQEEPPQLIPFEEMQQFRYFDSTGNEIPGPCQPSLVYEETVVQSSPMISTDCETTTTMLTSFNSTQEQLQPVINNIGTGFVWSNNSKLYLNERLVEYNH